MTLQAKLLTQILQHILITKTNLNNTHLQNSTQIYSKENDQ